MFELEAKARCRALLDPSSKARFQVHSLSPISHTYCSTVPLNTCGVQRTAPRQGGVQSARWLPASFILKNTVRKKTKNFSFEAVASLIDRYSRSPRSATSLGRGNQATGRLGYWVAALEIARTATSPSCLETPSYSTSPYPVERASAPLLRSTPEVTSMLAVTASLLALARPDRKFHHSFRHSKFRFADIMENRKNDLCLDGNSLPTVTESWCRGQVGDDHSSLCLGVATILNATCAELLDEEFLQQVVRRVGLANDFRGARIFGAEANHMRLAATNTIKGGMFQDPHQLAAALVHFGRSPIPIRTYLELGVLSAWTNAIISAFFARKADGRHEFHSYAVDVSAQWISKPTLTILSALNGSYVDRASQTYKQMIAETQTSPRFDVCFIDADHSYDSVRADYEELKRRCVRMMFHDVVDFDS